MLTKVSVRTQGKTRYQKILDDYYQNEKNTNRTRVNTFNTKNDQLSELYKRVNRLSHSVNPKVNVPNVK